MVNWLPTLSGMYYENEKSQMGVSLEFESDFEQKKLDLDAVPFIWKHMEGR